MSDYKVEVEHGKYTIIIEKGTASFLRYGEDWPAANKELRHVNVLVYLAIELHEARAELARLSALSSTSAMDLAQDVILDLFPHMTLPPGASRADAHNKAIEIVTHAIENAGRRGFERGNKEAIDNYVPMIAAATARGQAAMWEAPEGWRLRRVWNQSGAIGNDGDWIAEFQRINHNRYMRNTNGSVGHASPLEAIEAAQERIRALPDTQEKPE